MAGRFLPDPKEKEYSITNSEEITGWFLTFPPIFAGKDIN